MRAKKLPRDCSVTCGGRFATKTLVVWDAERGQRCALCERIPENNLWITTVLAATLPFIGCKILSDQGRSRVLGGYIPAKAVTDLPTWAAMAVKQSFSMMRKADAPCREYFASRSACSLLEVRTPDSEPRMFHLPFDFLQEGIHGAFALWSLSWRG